MSAHTPGRDHDRIWLQPWCSACSMSEDRNWCQDDVWGACQGDGCPQRSVEYIRADLALTPAEADALRARQAELLAALEEIAAMKPWVGEHPEYGSGHDAARESAVEIARAAIAKATTP